MGTLEISVRLRAADAWPIVAEYTSDDNPLPQRAEGSLALDPSALVDLDTLAYGTALGQALFRGEVEALFKRALARADAGHLRLLLFVEAPELRGLRWERLCAEIDRAWQPLATCQQVPPSRYLPSQADRRFPPIARHDLRALVVVASPKHSADWGLPLFDEAAAARGVTEALARADVPFTLLSNTPGAAGPPTLDAICAAVSDGRATMLHLVAHGRVLDLGPVLYLSRGDNPEQVDAVSAARLIDRLNNLSSTAGLPQLVFLGVCVSAEESAEGGGGLGQQLVLELGTPAVVAMADRVSVETATALATAFYEQLLKVDGEAEGAVDLALVKATAGLAERADVTVPVLFSRLGGRPLFTRAAQRAPSDEEVVAGLETLAGLVDARAPVLRPELDRAAELLRARLAAPAASLSPEAAAELQQARTAVEAICAEAVELPFAALATGAAPPPYGGAACPFPGMRAFGADEHELLFGRDALAEQLVERLGQGRARAIAGPDAPGQRRFLAVAGPGGSGKSSLVRAGLVPRLAKLRPDLRPVWLTPGELPMDALERALAEARQAGARELVVVVDQLEELLRPGGELAEQEQRLPFVERLGQLAGEQLVVVVVQADSLDECERYAALKGLLAGNTVQVEPLSAEELREAAERQAARAGLRFEPGLPSIILSDVRGQRGAMALAQHALRELWHRRRGRWLRTGEYVALGGVKEAIARGAEQIFVGHDDPDRVCLREIFLRLTRLDRNPAEGEESSDSRQRVHRDELVPVGESRERIEALLRALGEARLVSQDDDVVEVAHEALIRSWRRLRAWIEADRGLLLQLDDLRQAAGDWQRGERADSFLWGDVRLVQAEALAGLPPLRLNAQEQAFLAACKEARQRKLEAQRLQLEQERQLRAAAEASQQQAEQEAQKAREARSVAEQNAAEARNAREEAIVARTLAEASERRAVEQAQVAERERDLARQEEERARKAEAEVSAKARQLRRRFLIMFALALLASGLAVATLLQVDQNRRQNLLAQARAAIGRGDPDDALELAAQAPDDARSAAILAAVANSAARRMHADFANTVDAVAFSPDGASYLAAGRDGRLLIWDRASGDVLRDYHEQRDGEAVAITAAVYAAGGPVIGTGDGRLVAVGAASGQPFDQPAGGEITALAASPDGRLILSGDRSGAAILWDARGLRRLRTVLGGGDHAVIGVGVIDGGATAVVIDAGGEVHTYDTATWSERSSFVARPPDAPDFDGDQLPDACKTTSIAVVPLDAGDELLTGCDDGSIEAWSSTGELLATFTGHDGPVIALAALTYPDGTLGFVSSSYDQTVRVWDYLTGTTVRALEGHDSEVHSLAASPDGTQLLSGSYDESARLWDADGGLLERVYARSAEELFSGISSVVVAADGTMTVASLDGKLASWQIDGDTVVQQREAPGEVLALSADGRRALLRLGDDGLAFWDVASETAIGRFAAALDGRNVAALSAGGERALVVLEDGTSELRADDGTLLRSFSSDDGVVNAFAFSPDGARALFGYADSTLGLWSLPDGARLGDWLEGHRDEVTSVAFSPDGRLAISGSWDKTARIWDLERRGDPVVLSGHRRTIWAVAFSADGQRALTGSDDRTARLWRVSDGLELAAYGDHKDLVSAAVFSPDGTSALTASMAGEVLRWRALSGPELLDWLRGAAATP